MSLIVLSILAGFAVAAWPRTGRLPTPGAAMAMGLALLVPVGFLNAALAGPPQTIRVCLYILAAAGVLALGWRLRTKPESLLVTVRDRAAAVVFILLAGAALQALVRFAGIPVQNYDVLSYHLPLARGMAAGDGGAALLWQPDIFYARLPLGAPIIESLLVGESNAGGFGTGIQVLVVGAIVLGAGCAWRCVAWLGGGMAARALAAALYIAHPLGMSSVVNAVYDPVVGLMAVASLELMLGAAVGRSSGRAVVFAGMLAGGAVALKYSAIGTALVPLGALSLVVAARHPARRIGLPLLFAIGVAISLGPWLGRAVAIGGHPMHPFRGDAPGWTEEQGRFVTGAHGPRTPLAPSYWKDAARDLDYLGYAVPFAGISATAVLPLVALTRRRHRAAGVVGLAGLLGYALWLCVRDNPDRFLLPAISLLVPATAVGACHGLRLRRGRMILSGLVVLLLVGGLYDDLRMSFSFEPYYRAEYRLAASETAQPGYMGIVREASEAAPTNGLLLLFEAKGALFPPGVRYRTVWDQPEWAADLRASATADGFARRLAASGVTHLFVNEAEWGRFLDFYAGDVMPAGDTPWRGRLGLAHSRALDGLAAYPPHRFAGLSERDLPILREFLRSQRRRAVAVLPAGSGAEIWFSAVHIDSDAPNP